MVSADRIAADRIAADRISADRNAADRNSADRNSADRNSADESLDMLMPGADAPALRRAREIAQFLRLLCVDARRSCDRGVGLDLEHARGVLLEEGRAALERALEDLLRHHAVAVQPLDTFAWPGDPRTSSADAWREIEAARSECAVLPDLPRPGETAVQVGTRILAAFSALAHEPHAELWRARWMQAVEGPRHAERIHRELLAPTRRSRPSPRIQRAAIAGVAECLLERGAVREARAWLGEHALQLSIDPHLRQLFAWTRLALDDFEGARAVLQGLRPWDGPLPRALIELRTVRPAWVFALAGRIDASGGRPQFETQKLETGTPEAVTHQAVTHQTVTPRAVTPGAVTPRAVQSGAVQSETVAPGSVTPERVQSGKVQSGKAPLARLHPDSSAGNDLRERADCGASALVVFAFTPGRGTDVVVFDAAPALANGRDTWIAEREGACAIPGEREQVLVARVAVSVEHAGPTETLRGALGGRATRAIALAPVLDEEGDAAGWVHLEFEHHLVPSRDRLEHCTATWRRAILDARGRVAAEPARETRAKVPDAYAAVFRALVDDLGPKTVQRRWCGFSIEGGEPFLVAEGGEGQGFADFRAGRARGLARALATDGRIEFEDPDPRVAVHAGAASGIVIPLRSEGATRGLLAVESSRRRDFHGLDLEAWSACADRAAIALGVAQFGAWHTARFGFEPWFASRGNDFQNFARGLVRSARSRGAATIAGPAGAGKLVVARWLHFESARRNRPFVVQGARGLSSRADWPRLVARAVGGTLVLDDVEELEPGLQELLLHELEGAGDREPSDAPRIVVTTRAGLSTGSTSASSRNDARSGLREDLATRLDRLRIQVPPLAERREEIPGLAAALARRFAAEEEVAAPRFADDACALLWRQPWRGNIRELENLVYKIVLERPGEQLSAVDVARIAENAGASLARRIPTRHPDPRELRAALRTTCTMGARANKTRAALYLGWDPDTLVLRLRAAGLLGQVGDAEAWTLALGGGAEASPRVGNEAALRGSESAPRPERP